MIYKPTIQSVPLPTGLAWSGGNWLYQEKLDGQFCAREMGCSVVVGELLPLGQFFAFDCPVIDGQDVRRAPLQHRLECLNRFSFPQPKRGNGGEFLEAILASGGEGIVAKPLDSPYGIGWLKCKRVEVFYCVVTGKAGDGRQSVRIAHCPPFQDVKNVVVSRREKFEAAGNLQLRGEKFDRVRVGSILKLEAFGKHKSGLLREARLDNDGADSWLVRW